MTTKTKIIYVIGSMLLGVITLLCIYFGLIAGGVLNAEPREIIIVTQDAEKIYDGTKITNTKWSILSGSLRNRHTANVTVMGSQTDVGKSSNLATATIVDSRGRDVTDRYSIKYVYGTLSVKPLEITVQSNNASKIYDGEPLTCDEYEIVSITKPLQGHSLEVSISGTITEIGTIPNTIAQVLVRDSFGKDVTANYKVNIVNGQLVVKDENGNGGGGNGNEENGNGNGENGNGGGENGNGENGNGGGGSVGEGGNVGEGGIVAPPPPEVDIGYSEPQEFVIVYKLYSEKDGFVYLKQASYDDFDGKGFKIAQEYSELIEGTYSANYLTGIALKNLGAKADSIKIDSLYNIYALPTYTATGNYNYDIAKSDVECIGDASDIYTLMHYYYSYYGDVEGIKNSLPSQYTAYERAYRQFVYENYLDVPKSTSDYLKTVISENSFSGSDYGIVSDVANFIRYSAKYNKDYNKELDNESDKVVAFLSKYREGVCQHYAMAATMLYRQLGIPARYTVGFKANTIAGEWADVTSDRAHAWVEVYINGAGWVAVEVTGSSDDEDERKKLEITIKSRIECIDDYAEIDAAQEGVIEYTVKGLPEGYKCELTFKGKQVGLGSCAVYIDKFKVYDEYYDDVTDKFYFDRAKTMGSIIIYKQKLIIQTGSAEKIYDSKPLVCDEYTIESGNLLEGHSISVKKTKEQTNVGIANNSLTFNIVDENGNDAKKYYYVICISGKLEVKAKEIEIEAQSAEKTYDGSALTCSDYLIKDEQGNEIALPDGFTIEVEIEGSLTQPGRCPNKIVNVIIKNKQGENVTGNFTVKLVHGILRVVMPNDA